MAVVILLGVIIGIFGIGVVFYLYEPILTQLNCDNNPLWGNLDAKYEITCDTLVKIVNVVPVILLGGLALWGLSRANMVDLN